MNFHLRNRDQRRGVAKKAFAFFVVVISFLFVTNYFTEGNVAQIMRKPITIVSGTNSMLGSATDSVSRIVTSKEALQNENKDLKKRIIELELYAINNMVLSSENEELRKLLGSEKNSFNNGILAPVLSIAGSYPYGVLVISQDAHTVFSVGSLVFAEQNIVLGKIEDVATNNAHVRLLSAPGESTQALIGLHGNMTDATLQGLGNGNMLAKVARDVAVIIGDPVVLLDRETAIVGYVQSIETKPTDAFQYIRVRTPVNISTIKFVRVH